MHAFVPIKCMQLYVTNVWFRVKGNRQGDNQDSNLQSPVVTPVNPPSFFVLRYLRVYIIPFQVNSVFLLRRKKYGQVENVNHCYLLVILTLPPLLFFLFMFL